MKKSVLVFLIASIAGFSNCKEKEKSPENLDRYAQYSISVRKDTDLKDWLATLNKCERVTLLETISVPAKDGKTIEIAKVRLADDKEGYVESRHLAKLPIFFTAEVDVYKRPTIGSQVVVKLPKGTIAFILDEKDEWAQVYVGKIDGKYISNVWVQKSSFDTDTAILRQALDYEKAVELFNSDKVDEALEIFDGLREFQSVIGELAAEKYSEITGEAGAGGTGVAPEDGGSSEDGTPAGGNDTGENGSEEDTGPQD